MDDQSVALPDSPSPLAERTPRLRGEATPSQSRVHHNTLILLVNNAGGAALAFLLSVVIGRGLGAAGLGQYAFVMAWITPLTMLADFGLGTLITRDVARDKAAAPGILHTANRALPIIAGLVFVGAWGALLVANLAPLLTVGIGLAALLVILDPWYGLYTALFRAFERMSPILFINVGGLTVQLALTWLVVTRGAGLIGAVGVLVAVNVVQLAITWAWWRRSPCRVPFHAQAAPAVRKLIGQAAPFALAAVIAALGVRLNVLLLERLASDTSVGLYSAANRFVEAGRLLPNAFFGALFPALATLSTHPADLMRLFWRAARVLGAFSAALAIGLTLSAPLLLRLTYGAAFADAVPVLMLLAWSLVPSVLHALLNVYFYSLGREQLVNRISFGALVAQAGIGWLCVARWGAAGAALAVIVVECGALLVLWLSRTVKNVNFA